MDTGRIEQLIPLLPDDCPYIRNTAHTSSAEHRGVKTVEWVGKRLKCLNDPKFGWNFINTFLQLKRAIPIEATEEFLSRAFYFIRNEVWDCTIARIMEFTSPACAFERHHIETCLIGCKDLDQASKHLGLSRDILEGYAQLFFNIFFRKADGFTLGKHLYPETRRVEFSEGYLRNESTDLLMKRLAYNYGVESATVFGGNTKEYLTAHNAEATGKRVEGMIMSNAQLLSQMGGLNQSHMPGISHAKSMLAAAKQSGNDAQGDLDTSYGLNCLSPGHAILETVIAIGNREHKARRVFLDLYEKDKQSAREGGKAKSPSKLVVNAGK